MKFVVLVLMAVFTSSISLARSAPAPGVPGYDPAAIYQALKVKEKNLNPGIAGSSRLQKSVGGLVCVRSTIVVPGAVPSYVCDTVPAKQNFRLIYNALDVEEQYLNPGIAGSGRFMKTVGGLTCEKSVLITRPVKVDYDCVIAQ